MKISKKLLFTSKELIRYLNTVKTFSKIDHEILATVTYKYAYQKLHGEDCLISFPYKENKEHELKNRPLLMVEKIGEFIKGFSEENSPIDAILVNPLDNKTSTIRPLQIKFLGKGKYIDLTTSKFIEFLTSKSLYEVNNYTMIISIEGVFNLNLIDIATWLTKNSYPFGEVILIRPNNSTGDMEFYQLKPTKKNVPRLLIIKKAEMLREI